MRFRFGTDIGLRREENQDAVRCEYFGHNILAVVCDGMGGERAGKEASSLAIDEFFQHFSESYSENLDDEAIRNLLIKSVSAANTVIYTRARLDFKNFGMGTTCVAAFVTANTAYIINVGDSRAYLIAENGLHRITTDHNVSTLLFEQGKITEEEVENHPQKHMLVRAVGVEKTVTADTFILDYTDKISLLLCSDGLSGYCSDDEIYSVIAKAEFDDIAQELINLALNKGGRDNVTVAVISD
ncbi:Stp1/IreP family PP2C-type Ser/Thr phosphatase [Ruminococcus sp. XPD3002]|uniref:Stp1/IreP family PP2C-type Ser/Thr phosphatase n=1 Tax=Ruminococcus sp. XPD3002 TaxID=1452269 RepID=UPI000910C78E|nr:protein phosphatase [Ruminococcus flavefaciens]HRU97455.1 Stp1/IreP family PP2C-type Ser/Thr phosphatase [Ruminococcus sp.]